MVFRKILFFVIVFLIAGFVGIKYFGLFEDVITPETKEYNTAYLGDIGESLVANDKTKDKAALEAYKLVKGTDSKYLLYNIGNYADIMTNGESIKIEPGLYSISAYQFKEIFKRIFELKLSRREFDTYVNGSLSILNCFTDNPPEPTENIYAVETEGDYAKDNIFTAFGVPIREKYHYHFQNWRPTAGVDFSCNNMKVEAVYGVAGYRSSVLSELTVFVNTDVTNNKDPKINIDWLPGKGETKNLTFMVRYEIDTMTSSLGKKAYVLHVRDIIPVN